MTLVCHNCGRQFDGREWLERCPKCEVRTVEGEPMTETEEALKLSIIFYGVLRDLSDLSGIEFPFHNKQQAFQIISDAFDQAFQIKKEREDATTRSEN